MWFFKKKKDDGKDEFSKKVRQPLLRSPASAAANYSGQSSKTSGSGRQTTFTDYEIHQLTVGVVIKRMYDFAELQALFAPSVKELRDSLWTYVTLPRVDDRIHAFPEDIVDRHHTVWFKENISDPLMRMNALVEEGGNPAKDEMKIFLATAKRNLQAFAELAKSDFVSQDDVLLNAKMQFYMRYCHLRMQQDIAEVLKEVEAFLHPHTATAEHLDAAYTPTGSPASAASSSGSAATDMSSAERDDESDRRSFRHRSS